MSRILWLPDILSDVFRGVKGYQVDVVSGWSNRSAKSTAFEPIGVMNHHTGRGTYAALLNYMTVGSSIAPLSHIATSRPHSIKGIQTVRITIMAAGRCNHAGSGFLTWVGTNGGNFRLIGIENQNDGSQPWPKQQLEGIHITTAAILKQLNQGVDRMTEHKVYAPQRKVDRHTVSLKKEKAAVKAILEGQDMRASLAKILENLTDKEAEVLVANVKGVSSIKAEDGGPWQNATLAWAIRAVRQLQSGLSDLGRPK